MNLPLSVFSFFSPQLDKHFGSHVHTFHRLCRLPSGQLFTANISLVMSEPDGGPQHIFHLRTKNRRSVRTHWLNTLTHEVRKSSHSKLQTVLPICQVFFFFCETQCLQARPLAGLPTQIYGTAYQRFTWIYSRESALPWNSLLPRITSSEHCRQQAVLQLHMHHRVNEKHTQTWQSTADLSQLTLYLEGHVSPESCIL